MKQPHTYIITKFCTNKFDNQSKLYLKQHYFTQKIEWYLSTLFVKSYSKA